MDATDPHPASGYGGIDTRFSTIDAAPARATVERWLLTFIADHTRFTVLDAALLGWQWGMRLGVDTLSTAGQEDWVRHPMPATPAEWAADGALINPDTVPLVLHHTDGTHEYHVLYDTVAVDDDLHGSLDTSPQLEPLSPENQARTYRQFDQVLTVRERVMLGHLGRIGLEFGWRAAGEEATARVEEGHREARSYRRLLVPRGGGVLDVMTLVLRFLAESAWVLVLERRRGGAVEVPLAEVSTPLELGLAVEVTRRRLNVGEQHANGAAFRYLTLETTLPAPAEFRWGLVLEVAQLMEDLLLGHGPGAAEDVEGVEGVEGVEDPDDDDPEEIFGEPLRYLDWLMDGVPVGGEPLVATWLRGVVGDNPQFTTEQAVALAWQLWERCGDLTAGYSTVLGPAGDLEVRTEDEWATRGRHVASDARPLYAPGSHGEVVALLLAGDTEVVDDSAAVVADLMDGVGERDLRHHRAPTGDTPELESLRGYVSDYERDLLRNVTRIGLHVEMADWDVWGPDDLGLYDDDGVMYLPVTVPEDRSVMRMALDRVMNVLMADLLGEFEDAPIVDGLLEVSSTPFEEELAVLIAAQRLGLDESPVLSEARTFFLVGTAPAEVRWGLVYLAASNLDHLLRGYRWDSSD